MQTSFIPLNTCYNNDNDTNNNDTNPKCLA